jgi:hypothetical protein
VNDQQPRTKEAAKMSNDIERSVASAGSVALLVSVAALLLSGWTLYRTLQLEATGRAIIHAISSQSDVVCDLIEETQVLRARIESLERQAEGEQ